MSSPPHEAPAQAPPDLEPLLLADPPHPDGAPGFDLPQDIRDDADEDDGRALRQRRPISYPCGPDSGVEQPLDAELAGFNAQKRNSDPLRAPPPRSKTQVKPFTKESLERLEKKTVQLVREYGFQPRRKLSVEDGSRLPAKFEPFPSRLYGRPLEEIDNFIYDEAVVIAVIDLAGAAASVVVVVEIVVIDAIDLQDQYQQQQHQQQQEQRQQQHVHQQQQQQ
ncbi:hybrid signal transduction histidine kinase B-like [Anoplophora glabripennis]|uniref:hybrid signal transduction histidine kinase B-like n=1 Tax=Anoplophora glabripennis TaxID=217634 RepID=UPI0008751E5A|nr:hybrid signal transduction histidine kinase B-like [Anoplophora glabripennis]